MITKIEWTKSTVSDHWRTEKFGNLLSDTFQGDVYPNSLGTWSGWLMNWSDSGKSQCRFDFISKRAAIRWINKLLKEKMQ